jgi:glucose/arabinose dehydrogenase
MSVQKHIAFTLLTGLLMLNLAGCRDLATLVVNASVGPRPALPLPHRTLIPTVHIAAIKGWPAGAARVAAAGLTVNAYAAGLDKPAGLMCFPTAMCWSLKPMARPGRITPVGPKAG